MPSTLSVVVAMWAVGVVKDSPVPLPGIWMRAGAMMFSALNVSGSTAKCVSSAWDLRTWDGREQKALGNGGVGGVGRRYATRDICSGLGGEKRKVYRELERVYARVCELFASLPERPEVQLLEERMSA